MLLSTEAFSGGGVGCPEWIWKPNTDIEEMGDTFGTSIYLAIERKNGTISEACRDAMTSNRGMKGFPTIFTRYKLTRTGDAFFPKYKVSRQVCKFRDCFCNKCECSMSKIKITFNGAVPNVQCGTPRDMWASTVVSDPEDKKTPKSSGLCVERYEPGDTIHHFDKMERDLNKNYGTLTLVCAYTSVKDVSGNCINPNADNLIGCVEEPQKPSPPIYNPNIVSVANPSVNSFGLDSVTGSAAVISKYLALGSRFDAPIIQLTINNPNISYIPTLTLQVQFSDYTSGSASTRYITVLGAYSNNTPVLPATLPTNAILFPSSGQFPKTEYSPVVTNTYTFHAKIPSAEPNKVCACLALTNGASTTNFCDSDVYIGCVPRPTLLDSGYATVVDNIGGVVNDEKYGEQHNGSRYVINNHVTHIPNAQITFVKLDLNGRPLIFDKNGDQICKNIKDRRYYKCSNSSVRASYPWSTLDAYYRASSGVTPPSDLPTANALNSNSKALNTNFLSHPPVAALDNDGAVIRDDRDRIKIFNSIFEYRPIYDHTDSYPLKVKGYEQDVLSLYGVDFSAIIPQMSKYTHQPLRVKILTPDSRKDLDYCNAYSSGFSLSSSYINQLNLAEKADTYYVPAGTRWRSACRGKAGCLTGTIINGSGQDCSQSTSDIVGTEVKTGNFFLCDPNPIPDNYSKNCCSGTIANNFNFVEPSDDNSCPLVTGKCSAVISHDEYAEAIVCPGVYATEVGKAYEGPNNNSNPDYDRPNPSDLRVVVNSSMISDNTATSFPVPATGISFPLSSISTSGAININNSPYKLSYPGPIPTVSSDPTSVTRTVLNTIGSDYTAGNIPALDPATGESFDIDSSTGVSQAQSICVYNPDDVILETGDSWSPLGYTLNSPSDGFIDNNGLNAYLCDHIRQICKTITPADAGPLTGYSTWPRMNSSVNETDIQVSGLCRIGYSTRDGRSPIATCNDGWVKDANGAMVISNTCLKNCLSKNTEVIFTTATSNPNYNVTGGSTTFMDDESTVAVANGVLSGTCAAGYSNASGGDSVTATCDNGRIDPKPSDLCFSDCPAKDLPGTKIAMPGGDNGVVTAGGCVSGYAPKIVSGSLVFPTAKCSNGNWINATDTCVPSACSAVSAGNAKFISTVNNTTATATDCEDGFIPASAPSLTVVMPTMKCTDGAWEPVQNPCKPGCSGFTQGGSIFPDSNAGTSVTGTCETNYFASTAPTAVCGADGKWSNINARCGNAECPNITIGNIRYDRSDRPVKSGETLQGACMNDTNVIFVDASYSVDGVNYYYVNSGQKVGVGTYNENSTNYVPAPGVTGGVIDFKNGTVTSKPNAQCQNGTWVKYKGACEAKCIARNNTLNGNTQFYSGQYLKPSCASGYSNRPIIYCSDGVMVAANPPSVKGGEFNKCDRD